MNYEVDEQRLEKQGLALGVASFALVCGVLAVAYAYIKSALDTTWTDIFIAVPALFAGLIIGPIQSRYVDYIKRRQCAKIGHIYEQIDRQNLPSYLSCKRCGQFQLGGIKKG